MNADPQVTVLIDTYNSGHLIDRAIESALAQTYPASRIEILIVDDGSTDCTAEVVQRYADRVRYIAKQNGGQASALNTGFRQAQGEIICLLDGDDVFYPDKVRLVVDAFRRNARVGIVYNEFEVIDLAGNKLQKPYRPVYLSGNLESRTLLGYGAFGWPSVAISLRKSVIGDLQIPEEDFRLYTDYFLLSIVPLVTEVGLIETPLSAWVLHGDNNIFREPQKYAARANISIREYAANRLNKRFVTYLGRSDYGVDSARNLWGTSRARVYFQELMQIASAEVPLGIKARAELKLTASLLLPDKQYAYLKTLGTRLRHMSSSSRP